MCAVNRKSNHNQASCIAARCIGGAALISEAQRTSSMRIPSRARNLAPAKISFLHPAPLHYLLHLHLPARHASLLDLNFVTKERTAQAKRKMRNTPSAPFVRSFVHSFGHSFVPANVFTLPPPTPRKSVLRSARAKKKKRREGKKASEVINGRPNDSRVCDSETTTLATGANFHGSAFAPREMRARRRNERGGRVVNRAG